MITKTGAALLCSYRNNNVRHTRMQKRGSLGALLTYGTLAHVGQNALAHALMKFRKKNNPLYKSFIEKFSKGDLTGKRAYVADGAISGLAPELRILGDELGHLGTKFGNKLTESGFQLDNLGKRDLVTIRRLLRGNFESAAKSERGRQMIGALLDSSSPGAGEWLRRYEKLPAAASAYRNSMRELGTAWKNNALLGNLGQGIAENLNADTLKSIKGYATGKASTSEAALRHASELGVNAALYAVDPIVPAINYSKRLLAGPVPAQLKNKGVEIGAKLSDPNRPLTSMGR